MGWCNTLGCCALDPPYTHIYTHLYTLCPTHFLFCLFSSMNYVLTSAMQQCFLHYSHSSSCCSSAFQAWMESYLCAYLCVCARVAHYQNIWKISYNICLPEACCTEAIHKSLELFGKPTVVFISLILDIYWGQLNSYTSEPAFLRAMQTHAAEIPKNKIAK